MTAWTKCREKDCGNWVLAYPGVPRRCPSCVRQVRQAQYARYLHREREMPPHG